jgi:hypothetical protein
VKIDLLELFYSLGWVLRVCYGIAGCLSLTFSYSGRLSGVLCPVSHHVQVSNERNLHWAFIGKRVKDWNE